MLRLALALCLLPFAAAAQTLSAEIGQNGIAATEARLAALTTPSDEERFALGGLRFLGGVEQALQKRYRHAFSPNFNMIPVLRLPIPSNPAPDPFRPEVLREIFVGVEASMAGAVSALEAIPEISGFGFELKLTDLWFDVDADGQREAGEEFYDIAGPLLFSRTNFDPTTLPDLVIRFDVADSRWLMAYASILSAAADAILAYDPTPVIADIQAAGAALVELNRDLPMMNALDMNFGTFVDAFAVFDRALRQEPDRDRARAAHEAALAMVAHNRDFWRLVKLETDDDREWVPNDGQTSALGLTLPPGTGDTWLSVLADAELMLHGKLLIPYWRLGDGAGLNLQKMFLEPRPIDLVGWVQGIAALPYAERGPRVRPENWRQFDRLMGGNGMLFAAFLN